MPYCQQKLTHLFLSVRGDNFFGLFARIVKILNENELAANAAQVDILHQTKFFKTNANVSDFKKSYFLSLLWVTIWTCRKLLTFKI